MDKETLEKNYIDHGFEEQQKLVHKEEDIIKLVKQTAKACTNPIAHKAQLNVKALEAKLDQSGTARIIMDDIASKGIKISLNSQISGVLYDRQAEAILINPTLDINYATLLMAKELRRAWQHKNGVLVHPLTFHPDDAIIINRAQAADLIVSQIRIAWDLKLADDEAVWAEIMNSSAKDMARSFAREAKRDFRSLNNGWASQVAFEKWFLTDRARQEDKELIQVMLADHQGYVFEDKDVSRIATLDLISGLGEMPIGKNYLSAMAKSILSDPMYSEIRDRSNANFLWFIKFECSFRETERDLQGSEEKTDVTQISKVSGSEHEKQKSDINVLAFPGAVHAKSSSKRGQI